MACRFANLVSVAGLIGMLAAGGCGGEDDEGQTEADRVRAATSTYLRALEDARWARACGVMTTTARVELALDNGRLVAMAPAPGPQPDTEVSLRLIGGVRFPHQPDAGRRLTG